MLTISVVTFRSSQDGWYSAVARYRQRASFIER